MFPSFGWNRSKSQRTDSSLHTPDLLFRSTAALKHQVGSLVPAQCSGAAVTASAVPGPVLFSMRSTRHQGTGILCTTHHFINPLLLSQVELPVCSHLTLPLSSHLPRDIPPPPRFAVCSLLPPSPTLVFLSHLS